MITVVILLLAVIKTVETAPAVTEATRIPTRDATVRRSCPTSLLNPTLLRELLILVTVTPPTHLPLIFPLPQIPPALAIIVFVVVAAMALPLLQQFPQMELLLLEPLVVMSAVEVGRPAEVAAGHSSA